MGVSAAGYVGGKIARGPGPNIVSATGTLNAAATAFDLNIDGANLSKDATFLLAILNGAQDLTGGQDAPVTPAQRQASYDSNGVAAHMVLTGIPIPAGAQPANDGHRYLRFTVVNPDGEKSATNVKF